MRELVSSSTSSPTAALVAAGHAALRGWWEEVNESPAWQDGAFFSLPAAYALVSAVALIQLVRIQRRVPEFGWTTQKVFHLMNFVVNGGNVYKLVLLDLPGLLFFSAYTLLVLFWAEIYHQARSLPTDKLRIIYLAVNSIVYAIQITMLMVAMSDRKSGQICIWVYLGINDNALVELVVCLAETFPH
uniref:THH1/TOM1/TOM3 domain-containing protein n=1 Tax=Aegilops tauschii TaxID=37682 RepID=M8AZR5_AEGTA